MDKQRDMAQTIQQETMPSASESVDSINHWLTMRLSQAPLPMQTPEFISWLTAVQALSRYLQTIEPTRADDEVSQLVVAHLGRLLPPPPPEPLRIAADFGLPEDAVSRTIGLFAMRGAGKSYAASVLVEELVKQGLMVILIDPLGVLWGLRSSADGEHPGLPVLIFGGKHGDLPLLPTMGQEVCQALIDIRQPAILDLSHFPSEQAQQRFVTSLIEGFRPHEDLTLHVVIDEADIFAQQIPRSEAAQRSFEAMDTLIRRYRYKGLGATVITQRPSALHKNITDNLDALLVLRILSPRDTKAFQTWFERYATPMQRARFLETLPQLGNGTAWLWSPEWLKTFRQIQIRRRETFDSSATPKAGAKRQFPRQLAEIDLSGLQDRLAHLHEQANAHDPVRLRARIDELEAQLSHSRTSGQPSQRSHEARDEKTLRDQLRQLQEEQTHTGVRITEIEAQLKRLKETSSSTRESKPSSIDIQELRPQVGSATIEVRDLHVPETAPSLTQDDQALSLSDSSESVLDIVPSPVGTFLQSEKALLDSLESQVRVLSSQEKRLLLWFIEHDGQQVTIRQLAEAVGLRLNALYEQPSTKLERLPFIEKSKSNPIRYQSTLAAYCQRNLSSCPDHLIVRQLLLQAAGSRVA